jgi:hypothetical protein
MVDEAPPFTMASGGGREDDNLVATLAQPSGEVMDLHLNSAEPGQIAVREHRDLHRTHPRMRQDRS